MHYQLETCNAADVFYHFSIRNYMANGSSSSILPPVFVDTTTPFNQWPNEDLESASFHIVLCINMIHVAPWSATQVS